MKTITPKQFVEVARSASTVQEIMKKTGMTKAAVSNRLSRYRKLGILVPSFEHTRKINVDELNQELEAYDSPTHPLPWTVKTEK